MRACSAIVRVRSALRPFRRLSARRWPYMATTWAKLGSVWSVGCESACVTRPARAAGGTGRSVAPAGRSVPPARRGPTCMPVAATCPSPHLSEFRRGPPALTTPQRLKGGRDGSAPLPLAPLAPGGRRGTRVTADTCARVRCVRWARARGRRSGGLGEPVSCGRGPRARPRVWPCPLREQEAKTQEPMSVSRPGATVKRIMYHPQRFAFEFRF